MPRGQPDFGMYQTKSFGGTLADMADLAVRLGSIVEFDRRGDIGFLDDFEAPSLKWDALGIIGGNLPVLSTTYAGMGIQSVKLSCGAVLGSQSIITRGWGLIRLGRVGGEFWVQGKAIAPGYLEFLLDIYDGTNQRRAELRYDTGAGTITLVDPTGNHIVATGVYMYLGHFYFVPIKVVADIDTGIYIRLMVNEQEIDLSSYQLVTVAPTGNRIIIAYLTLRGVAAEETAVYIDNYIYTVNEP